MLLAGYDVGCTLTAMHRLAEQAPLQAGAATSVYASRPKLEERIASYRHLLAARFGGTIKSGVDRHIEYQAYLGELPLDQVATLIRGRCARPCRTIACGQYEVARQRERRVPKGRNCAQPRPPNRRNSPKRIGRIRARGCVAWRSGVGVPASRSAASLARGVRGRGSRISELSRAGADSRRRGVCEDLPRRIACADGDLRRPALSRRPALAGRALWCSFLGVLATNSPALAASFEVPRAQHPVDASRANSSESRSVDLDAGRRDVHMDSV